MEFYEKLLIAKGKCCSTTGTLKELNVNVN